MNTWTPMDLRAYSSTCSRSTRSQLTINFYHFVSFSGFKRSNYDYSRSKYDTHRPPGSRLLSQLSTIPPGFSDTTTCMHTLLVCICIVCMYTTYLLVLYDSYTPRVRARSMHTISMHIIYCMYNMHSLYERMPYTLV